KALENSDNRIAEGKTVTAYFLLAAFLWEPVRMQAKANMAQGMVEYIAYQEAAGEVISRQIKSTALPRHISMAMREVWNLQPRFTTRLGSKPSRLLTHPRFRAAYDFLLLRAATGGADPELAEWWTRYQEAGETEQRKMTQPSRRLQHNKSGRKKNYRKNTSSNAAGNETGNET
ncbi:MAG: polynucleotide adenylyltransferase PcnB, partial [Methylobacter sp.]